MPSTTFYLVRQSELTSLADAIRQESGVSGPLTFPNDFITNIPTLPTLNAVTISLSGDTLIVANPASNGGFVTKYYLFNNTTKIAEFTQSQINLISLGLQQGGYSLKVVAVGDNFKDSAASNTVSYTLYSITKTAANCTISGPDLVSLSGTATLTITPNAGFVLPQTVSVEGATSTYDSSTGTIVLSSPASSVTVSVTCIVPQLASPSIMLVGSRLTITENDDDAEQYGLYVNGVRQATITPSMGS